MVEAVVRDYHTAPISAAERAMLDFAIKLSLTPSAMGRSDVDGLRAHGFDDSTVHDIVQITALFAYYNRLAEGLGVDPEPEW